MCACETQSAGDAATVRWSWHAPFVPVDRSNPREGPFPPSAGDYESPARASTIRPCATILGAPPSRDREHAVPVGFEPRHAPSRIDSHRVVDGRHQTERNPTHQTVRALRPIEPDDSHPGVPARHAVVVEESPRDRRTGAVEERLAPVHQQEPSAIAFKIDHQRTSVRQDVDSSFMEIIHSTEHGRRETRMAGSGKTSAAIASKAWLRNRASSPRADRHVLQYALTLCTVGSSAPTERGRASTASMSSIHMGITRRSLSIFSGET